MHPIHKSEVQAYIKGCGYKATSLAPYSPFLNPTEEFWTKVKAGAGRDHIKINDNFSEKHWLKRLKKCDGIRLSRIHPTLCINH